MEYPLSEDLQWDINAINRLSLRGKQSQEYIESAWQRRIDLWRTAAASALPDGQWLLGRCCELKYGVPRDIHQAVAWYRKAAEQGHAWAQCSLGNCHAEGVGVAQDHNEAVRWYRKAAEQGLACAQYNLGCCCADGEGIAQDYNEAVRWYRKAAEQGLACAQYNLGCCCADGEGIGQDYNESAQWICKAAEQGFLWAQYDLGWCYAQGDGVPQDHNEAVQWFRKAAEQGLVEAQNHLGICCADGNGMPQDHDEAAQWFRKAAEQGFADAQCNLGRCYEEGIGVSYDNSEAYKWYRKAADQDDVDALKKLADCYRSGHAFPENYDEAVKWYQIAAEQGDVDAQCSLGVCCEEGQGVPQDQGEAVKWYRMAAEQGLAYAQNCLGVCCAEGRGVPRDYAEAAEWFRKAAEQGLADAQYNLGCLYRDGHGVPEDTHESVKWLHIAAEQGDADALCALGDCFVNGVGVAQDQRQALTHYRALGLPLSRDQFCSALRKGQGRAWMHLRHFGVDGLQEDLLQACLQSLVHNPQFERTRGVWLFSLLEEAGATETFREPILARLRNAAPDAVAYWDVCQLMALASQYAELGSAEARRIIHEKFDEQRYDPDTGGHQIIFLDGLDGVLHVAEVIGSRMRRELPFHDDWAAGYLVWSAEEELGKEKVMKTLAEGAQVSPNVAAFLSVVEAKQASEKSGQPRNKSSSLPEFFAAIEGDGEVSYSQCRQFGIDASAEDLEAVFRRVLAEDDPRRLASCLQVFSRTRMPRLDDRLFELAQSENETIRRATIRALSQVTDPTVRELGLRLLEEKDPFRREEGIDLLAANHTAEDVLRIAAALPEEGPPDALHGMASKLTIMTREPSPGDEMLLHWVYEHNPCSFCRNGAFDRLVERNALTMAQRAECVWDAADDTCQLARRLNRKMRTKSGERCTCGAVGPSSS